MKFLKIVLLVLVFSFKTKANDKPHYLQNNIVILEDSVGKLSPSEAWESDGYEPYTSTPNLGITSSTFWVKIKLNKEPGGAKQLLIFEYPVIDEVTFYPFSYKKDFDKLSTTISENVPFRNRKYLHQNIVFDIPDSCTNKWVFFKVKCSEQLLLPIILSEKETSLTNFTTIDFFTGLYFGIMIVMFLYNGFLYLFTRDKNYLYYVFYVFTVAVTQFTLLGYSFRFVFFDYPQIASKMVFLSGALVGIASIQFFRNFLSLKTHYPKGDKFFILINTIYAIAIVLVFFDLKNLSYQIIDASAGLGALGILIFSFLLTKKGHREALFFLLAWFMFLLSVIVFVLRNLGVLEFSGFTNYAMLFGSSFEAVLLSIALADRINKLKKDKEDSQKRELEALVENERLLSEQNLILEQKVKERTVELEQSNEELHVTLENLKDTQVQLVESEKMASLGQLTAGIAHEINNPINFVISNISPLKRDLDDLIEVINAYEKLDFNEETEERLKRIEKLKKDLDLPYLKEEIYQILEGISNGADRTSEIVKGLRVFSRLDEGDLKSVFLSQCVDSTLTIIASRLKYASIEITRDYQVKHEILCFPGKLNQVILNLINNSVDAIEEKGEPGKIEIAILEKDEFIELIITDNGKGMDESTLKSVFEPFFTTKAVGKGTGLGMAIVYSIIEEHNGKVAVHSEVGKGTSVILKLPNRK